MSFHDQIVKTSPQIILFYKFQTDLGVGNSHLGVSPCLFPAWPNKAFCPSEGGGSAACGRLWEGLGDVAPLEATLTAEEAGQLAGCLGSRGGHVVVQE